jgi:hypothetical protein
MDEFFSMMDKNEVALQALAGLTYNKLYEEISNELELARRANSYMEDFPHWIDDYLDDGAEALEVEDARNELENLGAEAKADHEISDEFMNKLLALIEIYKGKLEKVKILKPE